MAMQRLIFEEEHDLFREQVRRFMQTEIAPHVEAWRKAGICDKDAFRKITSINIPAISETTGAR